MILNDAGMMMEKWYAELENKCPAIKCHEHITMTNQFHCIIENVASSFVAGLRDCPEPILGTHAGSPLGTVVQWFKTMTTNEYMRNVKSNGWPAFEKKLWQRNYWEHIIRNEISSFEITA